MRILIATVTAGGGHIAAAAALEEAWRALRPDDAVERLDLIKFFSPLHKKIHADGYVNWSNARRNSGACCSARPTIPRSPAA